MKICIIGLGYIGLPTAAMFATNGHKVHGVDINKEVVEALNKGEIIIEEPYLEDLVKEAVNNGNLFASDKPEKADAFIICVPTPILPDKRADLSLVENAVRTILPYLEKGNIIILESTSPPGTTRIFYVLLLKRQVLSRRRYLCGILPGKSIARPDFEGAQGKQP